MQYQIVEQRNSEVDVIDNCPSLETAIESCLDEAESNGYISDDDDRKELEKRLRSDKEYTDGDVTVKIVEV